MFPPVANGMLLLFGRSTQNCRKRAWLFQFVFRHRSLLLLYVSVAARKIPLVFNLYLGDAHLRRKKTLFRSSVCEHGHQKGRDGWLCGFLILFQWPPSLQRLLCVCKEQRPEEQYILSFHLSYMVVLWSRRYQMRPRLYLEERVSRSTQRPDQDFSNQRKIRTKQKILAAPLFFYNFL